MHIPKYYREADRATILAFLKAHPFAAVVSYDGEKAVATHTPVEVVEDDQGALTIYSHMSRANPQWKTFGDQEVLVIFQGAHTYISPRWYGHTNVPTWNYQVIHVYGTVRLIAGDALAALLSRLVQAHEQESSYRLEGLPHDFVHKELQGVAGFALTVTRIDAGYKLSQNRTDEDHAAIVRELEHRQDADSHAVAQAMREQRPEAQRS